MQRKLLVFTLFIMLIGVLPAYADWYGFSTNMPSSPELVVETANTDGITLDVNLTGLSTREPEQGFVRLDIPDEGIAGEVGQPALPVITRLVLVPYGSVVRVSTQASYEIVPTGMFNGAQTVMPVQPSIPKLPGALEAAEFTIDLTAYERNEPVFTQPVDIVDEAILRGHRFVTVQIRPVNYVPASGDLLIAQEMTVRIDFLGGDLEETVAQGIHYADPRTDAIARRTFLNYGTFGEKVQKFAPSSYLIISNAAAFDNELLQDFIAWKTQRGYDVVTASTDETGNTSDGIKNYIKNAYDTWANPPSYVLLIGDTNIVTHINGQTSCATDLYYGAVDGADYIPDIGVGRLPVRNLDHLEIMLNKILSYEKNEWTTGNDWTQHATFMASRDNWRISEGTHDAVCSYFLEPAGFTCTKVYYQHGGTTQQALNALNTGPTVHAYSGHGSSTSWADGPPVNQNQVRNLTNPTLPLVLSHACSTGTYTMAECFAETWLRSPNAALAFWGASASTYWEEDDIIEKAMFYGWSRGDDAKFPSIPWTSGMLDFSMVKMYEHYSGGGRTHHYFEMYNLFGDPEVVLYSAPPATINPNYSNAISANAINLSVSVNDRSYLLVGLSMDGIFYGSGLTDEFGNAQVEILENIYEGDELTLTITGQNIAPYIDTITVSNNPADDDIADDDAAADDDIADDDAADDDAADDDMGDDDLADDDMGDDDDDDDDGCGM